MSDKEEKVLTEKEKQAFAKIEELECKYLEKYYYFLKFAEDEMLLGFKTKEKIKDDWYAIYKESLDDEKKTNKKKSISDFCVGAERIVYSLLNGKGIGQPNSAPVGSVKYLKNPKYLKISYHFIKNYMMSKIVSSIM